VKSRNVHTHLKIYEGSTVCACGQPGDVAAHDLRGEGDLSELHLLAIFCAKCAADGIAKLPGSNWLQTVALSRPGAKRKMQISREYKVYSLRKPSNRASVVIINGSNQFLCG
jgi:hypothetical protein